MKWDSVSSRHLFKTSRCTPPASQEALPPFIARIQPPFSIHFSPHLSPLFHLNPTPGLQQQDKGSWVSGTTQLPLQDPLSWLIELYFQECMLKARLSVSFLSPDTWKSSLKDNHEERGEKVKGNSTVNPTLKMKHLVQLAMNSASHYWGAGMVDWIGNSHSSPFLLSLPFAM